MLTKDMLLNNMIGAYFIDNDRKNIEILCTSEDKKSVKVDDRITNAIDSLLSSAEDLPDKIKRRVVTNITKLKKIVGV